MWLMVGCYCYCTMIEPILLFALHHCPLYTNTYTFNHKHTPFPLRSKLTGHIPGLHAPWGSILAVLSQKPPYLHSVSCLSYVLSYAKGTPQAYYFIG